MRRVIVDDTPVALRDSISMLGWCLLTEGVYAAVWFAWLTRDVSAITAGVGRPRTRDIAAGIVGAFTVSLAAIAGGFLLLERAGHPVVGHTGSSGLLLALACLAPLLVAVGVVAIRLQRHAAIAAGRPWAGLALACLAVPAAALQLVQLPAWIFVLRALQGMAYASAEPDPFEVEGLGALAPPTLAAPLIEERARRRRGLDAIDQLESTTGDEVRPFPFVVAILVVTFLGAYLLESLLAGSTAPIPEQLAHLGGLVAGASWWHVVAANFLHANPEHIAGNVVALVIVGVPLERAIGWRRMSLAVLLGVLATSAGELFVSPGIVAVGGSGIVYTVFGTAIGRDVLGRTWLARSTLMLVLLGLLASFTTSGVAVGGHVGGLAAGLVLGFALAAVEPLPADAARQRLRAALRRGDLDALAHLGHDVTPTAGPMVPMALAHSPELASLGYSGSSDPQADLRRTNTFG